jgi:acyl carrier protein
VDVEKSELDVLAGLCDDDWQKVRQLVVEVHDVDGRLERIASMLRARGYEASAQQDAALEGTGLYNLYAMRPSTSAERGDGDGVGASAAPVWHGATALVGDLREFLTSRLPNYMVPADIVLMESLPLTTNGKLDRRALLEPEAARSRSRSRAAFVPPRTQAEQAVAEIWSQVLGVERVGLHDNFFDLGGQSLLATQVMSRLREAFGVTVPLRTIFERPTVAAIAEYVSEATGDVAAAPPIVRAGRDRPLPLSFEQRRLWFLDQLMPGASFYNLPVAYRITGALDAAALEESVNRIVERHEALRTVFIADGDEPAQVVMPHAPFRLDFAGADEASADLDAIIRQEGQRPFDLARGPMMRAKLIRAGDCEHVLVVTTHHIAADGWSVELFTRELAALYEARVRGVEARLPELPVQYADYAAWQREWLKGKTLERQLQYWRRRLTGAPEALRLPTDYTRPPALSYRGAFERFEVAAEIFDGLRELGREENATLFMTLLAAYAALLARYSGDRDLVIGAPIASRARVEVENLIGFFTNTLVVRVDASGDPTFAELLRRVREVCLGAYAHQDVPFEKLVEELSPQRDTSRTPLFQVAFSLQDAPAKRLEAAGVVFEPGNVDIGASKFDLCLYAFPSEHSLGGFVAYNLDLFERATAARMVGHFVRLLGSAARSPGSRLSELDMLLEGEKALLGGPSGIEDLEGSFLL